MRTKPRTLGRFNRIRNSQREKDFAALSEQLERLDDPFEQAKAYVRGRGYIVSAEEPPRTGWAIGQRRGQTAEELVALAERLGWKPKERARRSLGLD